MQYLWFQFLNVICNQSSIQKKMLKNIKLNFTKRELQIIELISESYSDKEVADKLGLSLNTVRTHRKNILKQSENANMIAVVKHCLKQGLIS